MFTISNHESNVLGIRIARGGAESLANITALVHQLKEQQVDVLKLALKDPPEDIYLTLNKLHMPYYVTGILIEYRSNFIKNGKQPYLNNNIEFHEYIGDDPENFRLLAEKVYSRSFGSYFLNPGAGCTPDQEKQKENFISYLGTLNRKFSPDHYTHLIKVKGEAAGFITSYKKGDGGGVGYAGILKQFEGRGLYLDMISFIQNFGKEMGQKWGIAQVQLQNSVVQKAFQKRGMVPYGYVLNIHVNCLFGRLSSPER